MRVSFKVLLIIWVGLILILGGVVYTAYSKLSPEALIGLMKNEIKRSYPRAKVEIGSVDYRFSLDFKLDLKNLQVIEGGKQIGSIEEIEVKIPWWLFLTDKGSAQVNLSGLDITLVKRNAREKSPSIEKSEPLEVKASIPSYLASAKYTLRANNIILRDSEDSHRSLILKKLLVREFQYGKTSVYELTLPVEINHNGAKFDSELWLFGELTPQEESWAVTYRGEFKTKDLSDNFQLDDLSLDGRAKILTKSLQLNSELSFMIEKEKIGDGNVSADETSLKVTANFTKFPVNYLGILGDEIQNPFLPDLEGDGLGTVEYTRNLLKNETQLSSKIEFEGVMKLSQDLVYAGKWYLIFDNSKLESSFMTPNGEVSFFRRSIIDFKTGDTVQYNEEIGFSGIEFNRALAPLQKFEQFRNEQNLTYFSSTASFKECLQGNRKINGSLKRGFSPGQKYYLFNLKAGEENIDFTYQARSDSAQIEIEAKKFLWENFGLLEPYLNAKEAILEGKLQGKWGENWQSGDWIGRLHVHSVSKVEGEIVKLLDEVLAPVELKLGDNFQSRLEMKNKKLSLKSFQPQGADGVTISGTILAAPANSVLNLKFPKSKKVTKKEFVSKFFTQDQP